MQTVLKVTPLDDGGAPTGDPVEVRVADFNLSVDETATSGDVYKYKVDERSFEVQIPPRDANYLYFVNYMLYDHPSAEDLTDGYLATRHQYVRGTAGAGNIIGKRLQLGDAYLPWSDRELRFVRGSLWLRKLELSRRGDWAYETYEVVEAK